MGNKKQVTFWIEERERDKFSRLYSNSMSIFFRNCIKLALQDGNFFKDVFFLDNAPERKGGEVARQDSIF